MLICLLYVTQSMVWYRFDLYHTSHSMIETQHTTQQTMYVCIVTVGSTQQQHPPPTITRNHPRPPPTTSGHPPPPTTTHHRPPVTPDHPRSPPITSTKSWSITQFIYRHEVTCVISQGRCELHTSCDNHGKSMILQSREGCDGQFMGFGDGGQQ